MTNEAMRWLLRRAKMYSKLRRYGVPHRAAYVIAMCVR